MKDRLIESIKMTVPPSVWEWAEVIADSILADGWIRPPCKLGDTIYDISDFISHCNSPEMYEDKVSFITIMKRENGEMYFDIECIECDYNDFGNTLFLTREEAEAKLKEGGQG